MTTAEAIALAERALRRGMCSPSKIAHEGCATCEASEKAIAELHRIASALEEALATNENLTAERNGLVFAIRTARDTLFEALP